MLSNNKRKIIKKILPLRILKQKIYSLGVNKIDYIKILNLSEEVLLKFVKSKGIKSIDAVCGMSLFHSSYLPIIEKYSKKYKVDPRLLVYEVSKIDKSEAPENLVKKITIKF